MAIMSRASQMLAEATTVQKAKELKDLALTAQDWAKRKGMGEAAIQHCRSYALEAERKMGELLKATERAKGGRPEKTGSRRTPVSVAPTLVELGVSKKESSLAQKLASIPEAKFREIVSGAKTIAQVRKEVAVSTAFGPPPDPNAVEKDPNGRTIPGKLLPLWIRRNEMQAICTQLSKIRTTIAEAAHGKDMLYAEINQQQIKAALDQAYTAIKATMPYCLCPSCQGEGCRACAHRGLIGKFRYDMVIPKELKQ